jgi:hypothetical protein
MQFPDDVLVGDFTQPSFLAGSDLEGTSYTRKVPWKVHTQPHGREANMFKSFVGTATYGNEGSTVRNLYVRNVSETCTDFIRIP